MKSGKLDIKEKNVQTVLSWYRQNKIQINRRYQRKLAWSLEEKKLFINSIIENIPIPSIILAKRETDDNEWYEVIDGLQRLDALISFLTNEFAIDIDNTELFFNLETDSWLFSESKKKNLIQRTPIMDEDECLVFLEAVLPIVVINGADDRAVEEIFRRINSSGKRLSNQELRQSSSCNAFSDLVRKISCVIRGDQTFSDLLNLCDMKNISVSQKGLNYGIDRNRVFWRKHGIITEDNLRKSRDEELIAKCLIEVLAKVINPTTDEVDDAYIENSEINSIVCEKIREEKEKNFYLDCFNDLYNDIQNVFNSQKTTFSEWCYKEKKSSGKNDAFRMIITVLYELYLDGFMISDYELFCNAIKMIGDNNLARIKDEYISKGDWKQIKEAISTYFRQYMHNDGIGVEESEVIKSIKLRFGESSIETQMTEYKIGLSSFKNAKINNNVVSDIAKTLVAMSNTVSDKEGLIIVGVADTIDQANEWEKEYKESYMIFGSHYIVGIDAEAKKLNKSKDAYMQMIKDRIKNEPLDQELRDEILSKNMIVSIKDKELLVFRIDSKTDRKDDNKYNGIAFIRRGNSTERK